LITIDPEKAARSGLAAGQHELRTPIGSDAGRDDVEDDEDDDPGADHAPAVVHAGARETYEHVRDGKQAESATV
jgi:hypothetical protein